jgi:hypothetical protein
MFSPLQAEAIKSALTKFDGLTTFFASEGAVAHITNSLATELAADLKIDLPQATRIATVHVQVSTPLPLPHPPLVATVAFALVYS